MGDAWRACMPSTTMREIILSYPIQPADISSDVKTSNCALKVVHTGQRRPGSSVQAEPHNRAGVTQGLLGVNPVVSRSCGGVNMCAWVQ